DLRRERPLGTALGPLRTSLIPANAILDASGDGDPTGCGDVWGATYFSRLLAGDNLSGAIRAAHAAAARNVAHRGASGLDNHLRGPISLTCRPSAPFRPRSTTTPSNRCWSRWLPSPPTQNSS